MNKIVRWPEQRGHYIPGQIWHLTYRCHKKELLLKLVAGRTAQGYNRRKNRRGAFL